MSYDCLGAFQGVPGVFKDFLRVQGDLRTFDRDQRDFKVFLGFPEASNSFNRDFRAQVISGSSRELHVRFRRLMGLQGCFWGFRDIPGSLRKFQEVSREFSGMFKRLFRGSQENSGVLEVSGGHLVERRLVECRLSENDFNLAKRHLAKWPIRLNGIRPNGVRPTAGTISGGPEGFQGAIREFQERFRDFMAFEEISEGF